MTPTGAGHPPEALGKGRFVVVTVGDLPEAWFVVKHLVECDQVVAVLNAYGRSLRNRMEVLSRLRREHGLRYIGDLMAGRLLLHRYQSPEYEPFPEIDAGTVRRLRATVPVHDTHNLHDRRSLAFLRAQAADYILVAGAPVLHRELYKLARFGALNRHLGISPLYRGSDNPIWTLAAGDFDHFGYTIHQVSSRVGGGQVLLQRRVDLGPGEPFGKALAHVNRAASEGFIEVVDAIIDGQVLPGTEQPAGGQHYPPAPLSVIRRAHARYAQIVKPPEEA